MKLSLKEKNKLLEIYVMGEKTHIGWTGATWNVAVGCHKVDSDCKYCYLYRGSLKGKRYDPKTVRKTTSVFNMPLKLKEPTLIFTSSLTDFFIEEIDEYRDEAWDIIRRCPQHTFQILTKRPERIKDHLPADWGVEGWPNVWIGTSVGHQAAVHRIDQLFGFGAKTKFLSLEPLHGPIDLYYPEELFPGGPKGCCDGRECGCMGQPTDPPIIYYMKWVIIGGESGNDNGAYRYRPCKIEWIEDIISACKQYRVPVFVKQLGTHLAKELKLKDRAGANWDEWPDHLSHLKIREFPQ